MDVTNEEYDHEGLNNVSMDFERAHPASYSELLLRSFGEMYGQNKMTDFEIKLEGSVIIHCHKAVLYATSEYFKTLFSCNFDDKNSSEILLDYLDTEMFQLVIKFLYSGAIRTLHYDEIEPLVKVASFLGVKDLLEICDNFLQRKVSKETAPYWFSFGLSHQLPKLMTAIKTRYFEIIYKLDEFKTLSLSASKQILQHEYLEVSQEDRVLEACMGWWAHNENRKLDPNGDIYSCVKFAALSDEIQMTLPSQLPPQVLKMITPQMAEEPRVCGTLAEFFHVTNPPNRNLVDTYDMSIINVSLPIRTPWLRLLLPKRDWYKPFYCPHPDHGFFAMGGYIGVRDTALSDFIYYYDGLRHEWFKLPPLPVNRHDSQAIMLDNKIYIFCKDTRFCPDIEKDNKKLQYERHNILCLDLSSMKWRLLADPTIFTKDMMYRLFCVADRYVYSIREEEDIMIASDFCRFNSANEQWEHHLTQPPDIDNLEKPRLTYHQGTVYMICMKYDVMSIVVFAYNIANDAWQLESELEVTPELHGVDEDGDLHWDYLVHRGTFLYKLNDFRALIYDLHQHVWVQLFRDWRGVSTDLFEMRVKLATLLPPSNITGQI